MNQKKGFKGQNHNLIGCNTENRSYHYLETVRMCAKRFHLRRDGANEAHDMVRIDAIINDNRAILRFINIKVITIVVCRLGLLMVLFVIG